MKDVSLDGRLRQKDRRLLQSINSESRAEVGIDLTVVGKTEGKPSMNNILPNSEDCVRALESKQVDPKLERQRLIKADSDDIDIDALLKAVIDISDRLQSQEEKLNMESRALREREKKFRNRGRRLRPDTAVLRYQEDDSESLSGSDIIDGDKSDELTSDSATSSLKQLGKLQPLLSELSLPRYLRKNMSFSNDKVTHIDQENQRLLREILQSKTSLNTLTKRRGPDRVASSATVNRNRRQEQIERENAALLRRLETVKATPTLRRENLLREHVRSEMHARRISKSNTRPSSAKSSSESCVKNSDNGSVASSSKLSVASRASSARSRSSNFSRKSGTSTKQRVVTVWEPGW